MRPKDAQQQFDETPNPQGKQATKQQLEDLMSANAQASSETSSSGIDLVNQAAARLGLTRKQALQDWEDFGG